MNNITGSDALLVFELPVVYPWRHNGSATPGGSRLHLTPGLVSQSHDAAGVGYDLIRLTL